MRYATIDSCFRTIHITENRARPGHCSAPSGSLTPAVPSSALIAVSGTNGVRPILTTGSRPVAIHQRIVRRARPNSAATSPISRNSGTARWRACRPGDPPPASSVAPNPAESDVSFVSLAILRPHVCSPARVSEGFVASTTAAPCCARMRPRRAPDRPRGAANDFSPPDLEEKTGKIRPWAGEKHRRPGWPPAGCSLPHPPHPRRGAV